MTFHSYGQYILYPWGYARRDTPDRNDLHSLGLKGAQAAKSVNGRRYSVGTAAKMLYPAAGKLNFQTLCRVCAYLQFLHTCCHVALLTNAVQAEVIILTLVRFAHVLLLLSSNEAMCVMSILKLTLFVQAVFCQIP